MTFNQRLSAEFYARVQSDIRAKMSQQGIDVLGVDVSP